VDDFVFYYNRADNPKNNYIVYEVISTNVHTRADDVIMGRDFLAQIDVFSAKSFESKLMTETLAKLEEKLVSAGFEIEETNEQYEPDTRLYHQSMVISKIII
jgi:hypothetical protein